MPIGILLVSISITILSCEYKYNNLYDNSDYHFSLLISSCQRTRFSRLLEGPGTNLIYSLPSNEKENITILHKVFILGYNEQAILILHYSHTSQSHNCDNRQTCLSCCGHPPPKNDHIGHQMPIFPHSVPM